IPAESQRKSVLNGLDRFRVGTGLREVRRLAETAAGCEAPVLILGETGVGKEVAAAAIHEMSPRRSGPFIAVNCGAIPEGLIDSEFFGHEKGAFTGAVSNARGYFEQASGGTLFLDEIGEMSLASQVRLLRVLDSGVIRKVGGGRPVPVDVRIIAATNRDLYAKVRDGSFREDLWYRLAVVNIRIPPLRERKADIPVLAGLFLEQYAIRDGLSFVPRIPGSELERMLKHSWPGNIRELEHCIRRSIVAMKSRGGEFRCDFLEAPAAGAAAGRMPGEADGAELGSLEDMERRHIKRVLEACGGKLTGRGSATEILGVHYTTLKYKMRKYGLEPGQPAGADE
ncbi:MAG: sigma-54 dependent transcriptional regulator, partial [Mailhella sp.]|nr:sigma-54 dependent transcriptional regulator [Mailhella sp.]